MTTTETQTNLTAQQISNAFNLLREQQKDLRKRRKKAKNLKELIERERGERKSEKKELNNFIQGLGNQILFLRDVYKKQQEEIKDLTPNETENQLLNYVSWEV
jgi:hypothetical protein